MNKSHSVLLTIFTVFSLVLFVQTANAAETRYNFTDSTNNKAFKASPQGASWANMWSGTEATAGEYTALSTDNAQYADIAADSGNDEPFWTFNFTINENLSSTIKWIFVSFNGYENASESGNCYVASFPNSTWNLFEAIPTSDNTVSSNITAGFSDIIDNDKRMGLMCYGANFDAPDAVRADFPQVRVGWNTPPTFSNNATNTTTVGAGVNFTISVTDNDALNNKAAYIFSTNNTGTWVNSTPIAFTGSGKTLTAWNTTTLNSTETGLEVKWMFYANDTNGDWNASEIYNLTTTAAAGQEINHLINQTFSLSSQTEKATVFTRSSVLTPSFVMSNTSTPMFVKIVSQVFTSTMVTSNLQNLVKTVPESFSASAIIQKIQSFPKSVSQIISTFENTGKIINAFRTITGELSLSALTAKSQFFIKQIAQQFSTSLAAATQIIKVITVSVTSTLSDTVSKIQTIPRLLTQSFSLSDITGRLTLLSRSISDVTVFFESVITSGADTFKGTVNLVMSFSDAISRQTIVSRFTSLIIATSDSASRLMNVAKTLSQSLSLADATSRIRTIPKSLTESITASIVSDRLLNILRPAQQSFALSDMAQRISLLSKTLVDTFSMSDITRSVPIFPRLTSLAITITDSSTRLMSLIRTMTQTSTLSDTVSKIQTIPRLLTQSFSLSDITGRLTLLSRSISDVTVFSSVTDRLFSISKIITQPLSVADIAQRAIRFPITIAQSFSISGFVEATYINVGEIFAKTVDLIISFSDAVSRIEIFTRPSALTTAFTDSASRLMNVAKTLSQSLSLADATSRIRTIPKSLTESITASIVSDRLLNILRPAQQSFALSDIAIRIRLMPVTIAQTFNLSDITARIQSFGRPITASIAATDSVARLSNVIRAMYQPIALTDISNRFFTISKTITETITVSDIANRIKSMSTTITQTFSLAEITGRIASFGRPVSLQFIINALFGYIIKSVSISFAIPSINVQQGQFVEFDANVENTGTTLVTVSSGVSVYNSTDNLIATVNSSSVNLPIRSKNTIVTFLGTLNLSTGSYKADEILFFDSIPTTNITKLFNITSAANLPIGNYTNSSLTLTENTSTFITANMSTTTRVNMTILSNANVTGVLALVEYTSVENQTVSGRTKMSKFINIIVSPNVTNNLQFASLNISYTDAEVTAANLEESSLRIWFYNLSTSTWQQESNGSVDTSQNYVWANVTRLGLFGIYGTEKSAPPQTPSGGGGGGGGGIVTTPLPTVAVEFVKWPVLREVVAGQTVVEGIKVKNKGNNTISDLHVEVSGIPSSWVVTTPDVLDLSPSETQGFTLSITIPSDVAFGDYRALITLKNSGIDDSNFLILRVKQYEPTYDKPIITRIAEINKETNRTDITINVRNPIRDYDKVEIDEDVPKSLAQSSDEIQFVTPPTEIKRKDPLISWSFFNFLKGREKEIEYSLPRIPEEFTSLIYFPIKQMSLTTEKAPSGLRIVHFNIPRIRPGDAADLKLAVENNNNITKQLEFSMEVPSDWTITPTRISETIKAGERKEFKLVLKVPEDAKLGNYIVRAAFAFDGETIIREYRIEIGKPMLTLVLYVLLGTAIVAVVYYIVRRYSRGREAEAEYHLTREGRLRKIKRALSNK